ncbi:MAG: hypothetical protein ACI8QZ_002525 [Chlamydiales bacterium]|jgi:hypothetical protein
MIRSLPLRSLVLLAFIATGYGAAQATAPTPISLRGSRWALAYEHDASGGALSGSLSQLLDAIRNGADVKVAPLNSEVFYLAARTGIASINGQEHAIAQFTDVALVNGVGPPVLRPEPYHTYTWYDSSGAQALVRASIFDDHEISRSVTTISIRWWVRR